MIFNNYKIYNVTIVLLIDSLVSSKAWTVTVNQLLHTDILSILS